MSEQDNTTMKTKKKKKKKAPVILLILMVACLCVFGYSAYKIISQKVEDSKGENVYEEIDKIAGKDSGEEQETMMVEPDESYQSQYKERHPDDIGVKDDELRPIAISAVDFEALQQKNGDVKGWIEMPDTVINYPIAQAGDNEKYLRHLLDGSYHRFGTLFFDYRNDLTGGKANDDITYIYGHNIRAGTMFHTLEFFTSQSYYEEHPYCVLYLTGATYRVDLFAMVVINENAQLPFEYPVDPEDPLAQQAFLDKLKSRSIFKSNVEVTPEDKILGLFTCTNEDHSERYIVYGKLVPLAIPISKRDQGG